MSQGRAVFLRRTVMVILLASGGCSQTVEPAETIALDKLPREYVLRGNEWRWAWRIPGGAPKVIDLGVLEPSHSGDNVIRLGVAPRGVPAQPVCADFYVGQTQVGSSEAKDPQSWADLRFVLGDEAGGSPCKVCIRSGAGFWLSSCELVGKRESKPNVLVVLIDALREDHLSCYGYGRKTSPRIDALALESVRFTNCVVQSTWTRPSVASLLTGCYPNTHGAVDRASIMRPNLPTLGASLASFGYETEIFMSNPTCLPMWGIGKEFDRFVDTEAHGILNDGDIVDATKESIARLAGRPWFVYVHLLGTHQPYEPPEPYDKMFRTDPAADPAHQETAHEIDAYDGEIAHSDMQVGRLLDALRDMGLYDDTLIVLTADHGEQFNDHGAQGHGQSLFAEETNVPLIVKLAGSAHAGEVREGLVELLDVAPSILELVGAPANARFQGQSFCELIEGRSDGRKFAYASLQLEQKRLRMARSRTAKLIHNLATGERTWFDIERDPFEKHPLEESAAGALPEAQALKAYADHMGAQGSQGLNILITTGAGKVGVVTGRVRGKGIRQGVLNYVPEYYKLRELEDGFAFTIRFGAGRNFAVGGDQWHDVIEQDSARLILSTGDDAEVTVEVQVDDRPVAPSDIFFGAAAAQQHLDGGPFSPARFVADPQLFDPAFLERRFAVYVWYVPEAEQMKKEDLAPELLDKLHALGYMN